MQCDLPAAAVTLYESLRSQTVNGGASRRGLAAVCYHGMLRGLQLLATPDVSRSSRPVADRQPAAADDALVRQLANMILLVQSESTHVY